VVYCSYQCFLLVGVGVWRTSSSQSGRNTTTNSVSKMTAWTTISNRYRSRRRRLDCVILYDDDDEATGSAPLNRQRTRHTIFIQLLPNDCDDSIVFGIVAKFLFHCCHDNSWTAAWWYFAWQTLEAYLISKSRSHVFFCFFLCPWYYNYPRTVLSVEQSLTILFHFISFICRQTKDGQLYVYS